MKTPDFIRSPLAATAGVILGMALIAIPLRQLTTGGSTPAQAAPKASASAPKPSWITLRLLDPAESVTLRSTDGNILWQLGACPAGETGTRSTLPLSGQRLELILEIEWAGRSGESAAFLGIAPDGLGESTQYLIGGGSSRELLSFTWPNG